MKKSRLNTDDILAMLVTKAVEHDADGLEIEYKDGYEEVCVMKGDFGFGIARLDSSGEEAGSLRRQLQAIKRNGVRMSIKGAIFRLKVSTYNSFGECAYKVNIQAESKK